MRIIDLNRNGARHFQEFNKVLQNEAFDRLGVLIRQQLDLVAATGFIPPAAHQLSYDRPHQGILIEGGRGSGKTTFLLNALHGLTDNPQEWSKDLPGRLHVLPVIDPTLIETKEHIIILIISLIDAALDDLRVSSNLDRSKVNEARCEMAEGLGLLDGIGKSSPYGEEWEDPTWIMSRGLRKASKGRSFEVKFQKYINEALNVLKKTAFVLAFDDVDTNFQHGRTILETIRKYLTSPQLILMISGDLELYGRLVRRNIYETFGKAVMMHDANIIGPDKTGLSSAVQELEEQYLLKIVPPQNRIAIQPLSGILQTVIASEVKVIPFLDPKGSPEASKPQPLEQWASANIRRQLLEGTSIGEEQRPTHAFFELVSREHLRLVIGYLRAIGDPDPISGRRAVFAVFETRLRLAGISPMQLANSTLNDVLLLAFRWLVKQDKPTSLARFGVPSDADMAIILHCLGLAISQGLKGSPSECLRTLLTLNLPISMMKRARFTPPEVRRAILEFIWDDASPNLLEVAGRIGSIARLDTPEERSIVIGTLAPSCFGSVGTKKGEDRSVLLQRMFDLPNTTADKGIGTVKDLQNTISLSAKNTSFLAARWIENLAAIPEISDLKARKGVIWFPLEDLTDRCGLFGSVLDLLTYDRFSSRGEQFRSISAFSLLAAITKILSEGEVRDLHSIALTASIPAFLPDAELARSGQIAMDGEASADDDDDESSKSEPAEQPGFDAFMKHMRAWLRFSHQFTTASEAPARKLAEVSTADLARISERMHDQLLALDDEITPAWKTGHILHRQITNVIHALLVTTSESTGRFASPKSSDRPLVEALRRAAANDAKTFHPLAAIVISCPLVWAFLNPEESYASSGSKSDILRTEVEKSLQAFQASTGPSEAQFDPDWLRPPQISIAIGITKSASPRIVHQSGFYDVLNVVPRYYPKPSGRK